MSKITSIQTYVKGSICVVKVATDDGLTGFGQTAPSMPGVTADVLHTLVAKHFLGKDPWDLGALVSTAVREEYKYLGAFLLRAVSGIDTAIWDLQGQASGKPVYQLLGGKVRDRVPMYASSMSRETTPQVEIGRFSDAIDELGFRCAKVKIAVRNGRDAEMWDGRTAELVPLIRKTFGDEFMLSADANGGYSPGGAVRVGRHLEEYDYFHLEEPNPSWELDNMGYVADKLDLPIGAGEQEFSMEIVRRMISERLVDVIQPDICYIGGLTRAKQVAEMADIAGIPCTPHCSNRSMIQVFTAHLVSAMPACTQFQEWTIEKGGEPFYSEVPSVKNGNIELSDAPGWGVEILPSFLESATLQTSELG